MSQHNALTIAAVVVYDPNTGKEERTLYADPKHGLGPNYDDLSEKLNAQAKNGLVYRWLHGFRQEAKRANGQALQLIGRFPNTATVDGKSKIRIATTQPSASRTKGAVLAAS